MRDTTDGGRPRKRHTTRGVYAVASGKGGVGKTTVAANLAAAIAELGYDVAVVDADLGMANLDTFLGLAADGPTLEDVLAGAASVGDATYSVTDRLTVVPGGTDLDTYTQTDVEELRTVVARLRERAEYVFLDVGAGISYETVFPLEMVDGVLLVTTADPAALENAETTLAVIDRAGTRPVGAVLNRQYDDDTRPQAVAAEMGIELLGTVPAAAVVREALDAGTPVVDHAPGSSVAGAFRRLAGQLVGTDYTTDSTTDAAAPEPSMTEQKAVDAAIDEVSVADADPTADESDPVLGLEEADEPTSSTDSSSDEPADRTTSAATASEDNPTTADKTDSDSGGFLSWLWR